MTGVNGAHAARLSGFLGSLVVALAIVAGGCGDIEVPPDNTMPASCTADPDCDDGLTCTVNACESGQCARTIVSGRCLIGGACLSAGAVNPKDDCLVCDPTTPTAWTNACEPDAGGDAADTPDGASSPDTGASDVGPTDAGPDSSGAAPPPAPVLSAPQPNMPVSGVVPVAGQGEPEGSVSVELLDGDALLVGSILPTDAAGAFSGELAYDGASLAAGSLLTVRATQSNEAGTSPPATVTVIHQEAVTVPGYLDVGGAPNAPPGSSNEVYVRAFLTPEAAVGWVAETVVDLAADTSGLGGWSLTLPTGTYWVRAFRDDGGPGWEPDGQPTLGVDPQSEATKVLAENIPGAPPGPYMLALTLPDPAPRYGRFDVYTVNESAEPKPPGYWDPQSGEWVDGEGLCGGYYLRLEVEPPGGPVAGLSPPRVRLPSGEEVTLLDDGGCGKAVADNTAGSYDWDAGDGAWSRGLPEPGPTAAGTYLLSYRDTTSDQVHVEADTLGSVQKLSRRMVLTAPAAADPVDTLTPTFTWTPVDGAAGYRVNVEATHGVAWNNYDQSGRETTGPSYTPWQPLPDDAALDVRIEAFDVALSDPNADIDAKSIGGSNAVVVDTDGADTVRVTGTILNELSTPAPIFVALEDFEGKFSTAWLDAGATSFVLTALRQGQPGTGEVWGFADVAGTGDEGSPGNDGAGFSWDEVDLSGGDVSVEVTLRDPIQTLTPAAGATGVGTTPTFQWAPYASPPPGAWTWVLYAASEEGEEELPSLVWGLPSEVTSFDMAAPAPSGAVDLLPGLSCFMGGGTYDPQSETCAGAVALSSASALDATPGVPWQWGVMISTCALGTGYGDCVMAQVPDGFYAHSDEVPFTP